MSTPIPADIQAEAIKYYETACTQTEAVLDKYLWSQAAVAPFKAKIPPGVRPAWIAFGLAKLVLLIFIVIFGTSPISYVISISYPVYASLIAIESEADDDDTQWLTYWVIFTILGLVEAFTDVLLNWIPMYFLVKTGFMIWCMHPVTKGATVLYKLVLKDFAKKLAQGAAKPPASHVEDSKKEE